MPICICEELGCGKQSYQEGGVVKTGVPMSDVTYKKHLRLIAQKVMEQEGTTESEVTGKTVSLRDSDTDHCEVEPTRPPLFNLTSSSKTVAPPTTSTYAKMPGTGGPFSFTNKYVLTTMLQAANFSFTNHLSDEATNNFLCQEKKKLKSLGEDFGLNIEHILNRMPLSLPTVISRLGLDVQTVEQAMCPSCCRLYEAISSPERWSTQKQHKTVTTHCSGKFFSSQKGEHTNTRKICNSEVFTKFMAYGKPRWKPIKSYCYQKLQTWLERKLLIEEFEELLDSPLEHHQKAGYMSDVWDGKVWKTLKYPPRSTYAYTSQSGNLVFSLYVNWFNPHGNKFGGKSISAGAITLICLNLPPHERYKNENVFVFGMIPGHPSINEIPECMRPLVDEFQTFALGVNFAKTAAKPNGRKIRAVMFPLIADLPAMRKVAGFLSHSAALF